MQFYTCQLIQQNRNPSCFMMLQIYPLLARKTCLRSTALIISMPVFVMVSLSCKYAIQICKWGHHYLLSFFFLSFIYSENILLFSDAAPIWSPYFKTQIQQVEKVQRTAARWTCRRWRNTSSVGEMLDELQWPTLEAQRDQSSLLFFHKIHCGTMSIDKDKYLNPSQSTRSTRSSHN